MIAALPMAEAVSVVRLLTAEAEFVVHLPMVGVGSVVRLLTVAVGSANLLERKNS